MHALWLLFTRTLSNNYAIFNGIMSKRQSFFELLSDDALENIVRYLSVRPQHRQFAAYIAPKNALLALCEASLLRDVARKLLSSLIITSNLRRYDNRLHLLSIDDELELNRLMQDAGAGFRHIIVRYTAARTGSRYWLNSIARRCHSLVKLELQDDIEDSFLKDILQSKGKTLQSLTLWHLYCRERVDLIAQHCTNLRELTVRHLVSESDALWRSVGPQLEVLRILLCGISYPFGRIDPLETLNSVAIYCRKLQELHIEEPFEGHDMTVACLYASYGAQLMRTNVAELNPESCAIVAAACPNLRCALSNREYIARQMSSLGSLVSDVCFMGDAPNLEELKDAFKRCPNLQSISRSYMKYWSAEHMKVISEAPLR